MLLLYYANFRSWSFQKCSQKFYFCFDVLWIKSVCLKNLAKISQKCQNLLSKETTNGKGGEVMKSEIVVYGWHRRKTAKSLFYPDITKGHSLKTDLYCWKKIRKKSERYVKYSYYPNYGHFGSYPCFSTVNFNFTTLKTLVLPCTPQSKAKGLWSVT